MMIKYSVDRIVEGIAVLIDENNKATEIATEMLPPEIKEGDILVYDGESYGLDSKETADKREEVRSLIDSLFR